MKKVVVFCVVFLCMGLNTVFAQYDISLLHSASGKKWVQKINPDDNNGVAADKDDSFIFYSDGRVEVDYGTIRTASDNKVKPSLSNGGGNTNTKNSWTYTEGSPVIRWSVVSGGVLKEYKAEIQVLTENKLVVTLREPGREGSRTVILRANQ